MARKSTGRSAEKKARKNGMEFMMVGLGASAGGVKALQEFFSVMPPKPDMAFAVVLHLSPDHESTLAQILQNHTRMPVEQITGPVKVEPNRVYVIPPDKNLVMIDGMVTLKERDKAPGTRAAIDLFFRTLASAYGRNGVCVVLSGTGSDGTIGLKHIKEMNGFAIVQDPYEAEYEDMPRSAIATNLVDWVLPVAEIPKRLADLRASSEKFNLTDGDPEAPVEIEEKADLRKVLTLVRVKTGHDFSNYKQPTLLRRIARHLQIHGLDNIGEYLPLLRDNPDEMRSLIKNLLINVTNFFRDPEAFEVLQTEVVPKLFEGKTANDTIRIWSTGCASGEEAYSLAILLAEYTTGLTDPPTIQIFAMDVDDDAIAEARENSYPETIEADVSPERLRMYFTKAGGHYRIKKELREMILFAPHNILRDPPFSRLDLVVCRNMLIYLNRETQDKVLKVFHFAMNAGGFLFLGNSESAEGQSGLFAPVDKKLRIYSRRPTASRAEAPELPLRGEWQPVPHIPVSRENEPDRLLSFGEMHYKLVEQYAPPSVMVNGEFEIVHLSESAGKFLRFAGGEPTNSLLKAVLPDLIPDLRAALYAARQEGEPAEFRNVRMKLEGKRTLVNLIVRPVELANSGGMFLLVIFDEGASEDAVPEKGKKRVGSAAAADDAMGSVVRNLEEDLRRTKSRLQTTIEQHETSIEELKASNEELQAVNEELRSASEELETGKEELQSVNEELTTVNQELKEKIEETSRVNSDLQNLMASTDIGTIFLDRSLRVKRYTLPAETLFNIIPGDIGRPLEHVTHKLDYQQLAADCREVLKTLKTIERELGDIGDRWFLMRILPYRTTEDRIEGVVVTFIDITERRAAENRLRWLATVVESSNDAIFSFAFDRKIVSWNKGAEEIFGYLAKEAIGHPLSMLTQPGREKEENKLLEQTWGGDSVENFETVQMQKSGAAIDISLNLSPIRDEKSAVIGMMATVRDITKRKESDQQLRETEERQRLLIESAEDYAIFTLTTDGIVNSWNSGAERVFGYREEEILGKPGDVLFTPEDRKKNVPKKEMETARENGRAEDERYHIRKDETRFFASGVMTPLFDGGLHGFAKIARDLTNRKQMEENLREARDELEERVDERTAELAELNESLRQEIVERERVEDERVGLLRKIVAAQEDERQRIARDLHDQLGQQMTALRLKLESLKTITAGDVLFEELEKVQAQAKKIDEDVSFLAWELRPTTLDDLGLRAALENFVREWSRNYGIAGEFHTARIGKDRLAPDIETALYRITQEALNNVMKHAQAAHTSVLLEARKDMLVLIVEDDGIGFDAETDAELAHSGKGLGLIGMQERAAIVGGKVEIESSPGKGTTVFAKVPLRRAGEEFDYE